MNKVIVGQKHMIERLLIGLLARTYFARRCSGLAKHCDNTFTSGTWIIQFTVYCRADVVGTMIYNIKQNEFSIKKGQFCQFRFGR
jgi:MoxR-like ATPase